MEIRINDKVIPLTTEDTLQLRVGLLLRADNIQDLINCLEMLARDGKPINLDFIQKQKMLLGDVQKLLSSLIQAEYE